MSDLMQKASIAIWAPMAAVQSIVRGTAAQGEGPSARHGAPQFLVDLDRADTHPPKPRL